MWRGIVTLGLLLVSFVIFFTPAAYSVNSLNKYPLNPVISPQQGTFDSSHTHAISILNKDQIYKCWYAGHNGTRWQIGYATSSNAISWDKYSNNPVLPYSPADATEQHVHTPHVLFDESLYKMWYTASPNDTSNWTIRYATSNDGINWTKHGQVLGPTQSWWDTQGVVWPIVIHETTEYQMWYGARHTDGVWRIGYAISDDGINWTPDSHNPVINLAPYGSFANNPFVYLKDNQYEILFQGFDNNIIHGISLNGIEWTNFESVLIRTPNTFDSDLVSGAELIELSNGTNLIYYSGRGNLNGTVANRIGFAADGPLPGEPTWTPTPSPSPTPTVTPTPTNTPTPTPSPTPSPTPTPTLTPTPTPTPSPTPSPTPTPTASPTPTATPTPTIEPTPTPTPTPAPAKKVIIIPGMFGSWNTDAFVHCKLDDYRGDWMLFPGIGWQVYGPIIQHLKDNGIDTQVFTYDWRQDIRVSADRLSEFIDAHTATGERIHLVGHSMGGLVARAYAGRTQAAGRIDRLLTVGSPHTGTVLAYPSWSGGQIWNDNLFMKIALTTVVKRCNQTHRISDIQTIRQYVPSTQNLLPVFNYLTDKKSGQSIPYAGMSAQNSWLPDVSFIPPFGGAWVGSIHGVGRNTLVSLSVKSPNKRKIERDLWDDGKPADKFSSPDGDGTVLADSASIPDAENISIPGDHIGIITTPEAVRTISDFLGISPITQRISTTLSSTPQSAAVILSYPSRSILRKPDGELVPDTDGMITLLSPESADYPIVIQPKSLETLVVIGQFQSNGDVSWKEYRLRNILPKFRTVRLDFRQPVPDPLR